MNELTKKKIGQRINAALANTNCLQKELAGKLGVPDNTISYFVSGARTPNLEQIIKMSEIFHVSTDYLLGLTDSSSTDTTIKAICNYTGLSDKAVDVLHAYFNDKYAKKKVALFSYLAEQEYGCIYGFSDEKYHPIVSMLCQYFSMGYLISNRPFNIPTGVYNGYNDNGNGICIEGLNSLVVFRNALLDKIVDEIKLIKEETPEKTYATPKTRHIEYLILECYYDIFNYISDIRSKYDIRSDEYKKCRKKLKEAHEKKDEFEAICKKNKETMTRNEFIGWLFSVYEEAEAWLLSVKEEIPAE